MVDRADAALGQLPTDPNDPPTLLGFCHDARTVTREAAGCFRVPDTRPRGSWGDFVRDATRRDATRGADACVTSVRGHDIASVMLTVVDMENSVFDVELVELWINAELNP